MTARQVQALVHSSAPCNTGGAIGWRLDAAGQVHDGSPRRRRRTREVVRLDGSVSEIATQRGYGVVQLFLCCRVRDHRRVQLMPAITPQPAEQAPPRIQSDSPVESVARDTVVEELRMRQVSYILGIPQPTIRSWERRYGLRLANRSSGGHRRFTGGQVDQLRWMRDLVARGRSAVDAAAVVNTGHRTSNAPMVEGLGKQNRSPTSR
jgi:hypothetical protein